MSQGEIVRPQDIGLSQDDQRALMDAGGAALTRGQHRRRARMRLVR
jgi:(2S)-methylsuccinyl-CoA dehydrogenase